MKHEVLTLLLSAAGENKTQIGNYSSSTFSFVCFVAVEPVDCNWNMTKKWSVMLIWSFHAEKRKEFLEMLRRVIEYAFIKVLLKEALSSFWPTTSTSYKKKEPLQTRLQFKGHLQFGVFSTL